MKAPDQITVKQTCSTLFGIQFLGLILGLLSMAFGLGFWPVIGSTVLIALCLVVYRTGLYYGTRGWSVTRASTSAGKSADGGWAPASVRRAGLYYIIPCYILTAAYILAYLISGVPDVPDTGIREEIVEEIAEDAAVTPDQKNEAVTAEAFGQPDETAAAAGTVEATDLSDAADGAGGNDSGEEPIVLAGPVTTGAQITRLLCWIGALPFLPPAMFAASDMSIISLPIAIVFAVYPFVLPGCYMIGYLGGKSNYEKMEKAMVKGRRRARARSRVMKNNKPVI